MSLEIKTISEKTNYVHRATGFLQEATQEFWVDVGGLGRRSAVIALLKGDNRLPREYSQSKDNSLMFAMPVTYDQMEDMPNIWKVVVNWKTITNISESIPNPADCPALISVGTYFEQDNPDVDFNGKPLTTTAGEPIDWPHQKGYPVYTVEKNYNEFPKQFGLLRDFVNSDTVTIYGIQYDPYTLFCPDVRVSHLQWKNNFPFHAFSCSIYVNTKRDSNDNVIGWRQLKRNAGYHERKFLGFKANYDTSPNPYIYPTLDDARSFKIREDQLEPVFIFKVITLGEVGHTQYPTSPVLLTPFGTAYREKVKGDQQKAIDFVDATVTDAKRKRYLKTLINQGDFPGTGKILGLKVDGEKQSTSGITPEQWEAAVVEGVLYNLVPFGTYFPLDGQDIPKNLKG